MTSSSDTTGLVGMPDLWFAIVPGLLGWVYPSEAATRDDDGV
jgi:hypothetical protein